MALSLALGEGGNEPESIQTQAKVSLRNVEGLPTITKVALTTRARVPGLEDEAFQKTAIAAKDGCIVSRALAGSTRSRSRRRWRASAPGTRRGRRATGRP